MDASFKLKIIANILSEKGNDTFFNILFTVYTRNSSVISYSDKKNSTITVTKSWQLSGDGKTLLMLWKQKRSEIFILNLFALDQADYPLVEGTRI